MPLMQKEVHARRNSPKKVEPLFFSPPRQRPSPTIPTSLRSSFTPPALPWSTELQPSPTMSEAQKIAIVSVYDKTGLLDLAKGLVQQNVRILASGGTARMIRESGFPVE